MPEIGDFEGIIIGLPGAASLVDASLRLADQLQTKSGGGTLTVTGSQLAMSATLTASNALLALASAMCTLGAPPQDIGAVTDNEGNLILRCGHRPPHEWNYGSGTRL